jgi:hypothetical protein
MAERRDSAPACKAAGCAMAQYRIYTLTADEHIRTPPEVIECADDEAAVRRAKHILDGHAVEVWQLGRQVIRLEPKG